VKFLYLGFLVAPALFLVACALQNNQVTPHPPPAYYSISGTVVNLAGSNGGLVLQNDGRDDLPVNASGNFQFATSIASGSAFNVAVLTQPSNPVQQCSVANGSGTAMGSVNSVKVECGHNEWAWMPARRPSTRMVLMEHSDRLRPRTLRGDANLPLCGPTAPEISGCLVDMVTTPAELSCR
jgi:hypothetical protein